jgi:glycosyltransferase involved in cell wall biosynthesis
MRVIRFLPSGVYGGPHNEVAELDAAFRKAGVCQIAVVPKEAGDAVTRLKRAGIDVRVASTWRPRRTASLRFWLAAPIRASWDIARVRALVESEECEVAICSGAAIQIAIGARLGGARVVWIVADTSLPLLARAVLMLLARAFANAILVTGRSLLDHYPGAGLIRRRAVTYFPPVDLNRFQPGPRNEAAHLVVGTVGHLNPDKGIDVLVASATSLAQPGNVQLLIVAGEHSTHTEYAASVRNAVERAASRLPISLQAPTSRVERVLRQMDVFVSPSRREGASTAVIEAQACGLPVVAADVGAIRELVEDGRTGFLVPPENPDELADAVIRLVIDADLRRQQGDAAATRARRMFGIEATASAFLAAFRVAGANV